MNEIEEVVEEEERALVPREGALVPAFRYEIVTKLSEMKAIFEAQRQLLRELMVPGTDFGSIPGTTDDRTLFKPGAEKLLILHGYSHEMHLVDVEEEFDLPFFFYRYRCDVYDRRSRVLVGHAFGSCNSRESKYAYRWVTKSRVPPGLDLKSLPTRKNRRGWNLYRIPNPDICDLVNTIDKMAQKRAFVGAVRITTGASGLFAEEGIPPEEERAAEPATEAEEVKEPIEEGKEEEEAAVSKIDSKVKLLYNKANAALQKAGLKAYYRSLVQVENTIVKEAGLSPRQIMATSEESLVNLLVKHAREKLGKED